MPIQHYSPVALPVQPALALPDDPAPCPLPPLADGEGNASADQQLYDQLPRGRSSLISRLKRNVRRVCLNIRNGLSLKCPNCDRDDDRMDRTPNFPSLLDDDLAVERALRCLFADDYQAMLDDRRWLEDELLDRLCNPASSDLQRSTAQAQLKMLDGLEREWYRAKTLEVLRRLAPEVP